MGYEMQDAGNGGLLLAAEHLKKSFRFGKKKVLKDICLTVYSGECIGILGANGCGKSTLLSLLAGIVQPDSGSVQKYVQAVGYVPQECPLMEELSALDNLRLWYCDSPLSLEEELNQGFLAMLGIPSFLKVLVKNMSGGMKKRLSIGCAAAKKPRILLLDEPGAALDLICKERIEVYLKTFQSQGNAVLLATHEEREIALCDRLFILKEGILHPLDYDGNIHMLAGSL